MFRFSYVNRILIIFFGAVVAGLVLKTAMIPESFGKYGHYRADWLSEGTQLPSIYQGKFVCQECHNEIFQTHEKDVHVSVECENCHGNGKKHVDFHKKVASASVDTSADMTASGGIKDQAKMHILKDNQTCLYCHRQLKARPKYFPQIDPDAHFELLKVKDKNTTCFSCHSPHEPLFLVKKVSESRVHPTINECKSCHDESVSEPRPENHPTIFECKYCHKGLIDDFKAKKHKFLNCTSCHNVYRISESSGYIFKNGNPKFCLMCHEDKNIVDSTKVPVIKQKEHYEMMGATPDMRCFDCHGAEKIHDISKNPFYSAGKASDTDKIEKQLQTPASHGAEIKNEQK
ncbi:MAG: hypothetical protein HQM09_14270 [Candidatus Riflebacteria bacterium]|nr:hypothetical protein [Candidatus Riflebacteria bacterium]